MKRDMDLIRSILLNVESDGTLGVPGGYTNEELADHAQQLVEEGLVEGVIARNGQGVPVMLQSFDSRRKDTTL